MGVTYCPDCCSKVKYVDNESYFCSKCDEYFEETSILSKDFDKIQKGGKF